MPMRRLVQQSLRVFKTTFKGRSSIYGFDKDNYNKLKRCELVLHWDSTLNYLVPVSFDPSLFASYATDSQGNVKLAKTLKFFYFYRERRGVRKSICDSCPKW